MVRCAITAWLCVWGRDDLHEVPSDRERGIPDRLRHCIHDVAPMSDLTRTIEAMEANGWSWCFDTGGFRKGEMWVSRDQAVEAFLWAERGENSKPSPVSETVAKIVAKVANG